MQPRGPSKLLKAGRLVGREKIVGTLSEHLCQGRSTLLVGPAGIGKTAILHAVVARARESRQGPVPILCAQAPTLKALLISLADALLAWAAENPIQRDRTAIARHRLHTHSVAKLQRLVIPWLRSGSYTVLLDHVGQVRARYADFLDELGERWGIPVIAAIRSLDPDETGRMWWVGVKFEKVEVPGLAAREARQLIEQTLQRAGTRLPDHEEFVRGLIRLAHGQPRVITRVCDLAKEQRYQIGGHTNLRLLLFDLKLQDL